MNKGFWHKFCRSAYSFPDNPDNRLDRAAVLRALLDLSDDKPLPNATHALCHTLTNIRPSPFPPALRHGVQYWRTDRSRYRAPDQQSARLEVGGVLELRVQPHNGMVRREIRGKGR